MAGVIQLVSRLPHSNGLPADTFENVQHLEVAGSDPAGQDIIDAMNAFRDFYITDPGAQLNPLSEYISEVVNRGADACTILAYFTNDLSGDTVFGSPIGQLSFTLPATSSTLQLPEEVAVVLSLHGDLTNVPVSQANPSPPPATIRPQQRRRGRLYLGPLGQNAGTETAGSYRPNVSIRQDIGTAFEAYYSAIVGVTPWVPAVWSKADEATHPITGGYVDDAWDTQRRRGLLPTLRTEFTI